MLRGALGGGTADRVEIEFSYGRIGSKKNTSSLVCKFPNPARLSSQKRSEVLPIAAPANRARISFMQTAQKNNISNLFEPLDRSPFKIFVLYEDTLTGMRANAVLGRLTDQLEVMSEIESQIWKFDSLSHPELWEQASAQAVAAEMIVVSACGNNLLPSYVKDLIEEALSGRQRRKAAVVALLDWEQDQELSHPALGALLFPPAINRKVGHGFLQQHGRMVFCS